MFCALSLEEWVQNIFVLKLFCYSVVSKWGKVSLCIVGFTEPHEVALCAVCCCCLQGEDEAMFQEYRKELRIIFNNLGSLVGNLRQFDGSFVYVIYGRIVSCS